MKVPEDFKYTSTHEWVDVTGDTVTVGITEFAQNQLSDITFVELSAVGDDIAAGAEVAVVESVKAASDIYSPVSGKITEVNKALVENPEIINSDPFGKGWLYKCALSDTGELDNLLSAGEYQQTLPAE